jgi:hypothetical protein
MFTRLVQIGKSVPQDREMNVLNGTAEKIMGMLIRENGCDDRRYGQH